MIENIWLVYLGLGLVLIVIVAGALVLWTTTSGDFETSRLRYAAATSLDFLLY
jgi:hypothetical protein